MASSARVHAEEQIDRFRRGLAARLLGPSLLLLHVGVFLVTATVLILLNLYRHPSGLTISGVLRTWAAIVAFHALVVALYPIVRWGVVKSEIEGDDPLQRLRVASSRLRTPVRRSPSADGRVPLTTRLRQVRTPPIPLAAFQGQSVQAVWQRVTVRWQRLTNAQVMPPEAANGVGELYHNGHNSLITTESGAYEVVAASQIISGSPSPSSSWPQRDGARPTNGASTHQVQWPQRPGAVSDNGTISPEQSPAPLADPGSIAAASDGASEAGAADPPRWDWVEAAAAAWLARQEQDELEPHNDGGTQESPAPPVPPVAE